MNYTFEGLVLQRTARGVLFISHYWEAPMWFPLSQTEAIEDGEMTCIFKVKSWLANKCGIEEFSYYSEEEIKRAAGV